MIKKLLFVFGFLFFSSFTQAQIVSIPDANFKTALLNYTPVIDTNSDGEIQLSEALVVTEFNLGFSNISDATGINSFTNLQSLNIGFNQLTELDVTSLNQLTSLICYSNQLTSLNVSTLTNLTYLECYSNQLTVLDATPLIHLTSLNCSDNQLATLNVTSLINLTSLVCHGNQLTSLDTSTLTNLTQLVCYYNLLTSLNVTSLTHLTSLTCNNNQLTSLDVTSLINLTTLICSGNQITSLDVSNLTNLTGLYCEYNNLSSIDISTLINLVEFKCSHNNITSLNVPDSVYLQKVLCDYNQLSNIEIHNPYNLQDFNCGNNLLTSLDLSHLVKYNYATFQLWFENNPNLVYVNLKSNTILPSLNFWFRERNCPALRYICTNENSVSNIIYQMQDQDSDINSTISSNVQVNSYCSFVPGGNYNTITGNLTLDINNDGCGINDIPLNEVKLFINDGTNSGAGFTNTTGDATFYTQAGNFVITPNFENPFFTVSPTSATLTFADNNNNTQTRNFCITSLGIHNDLDIVIIPIAAARPGFDANYRLVYKNKGNQVQSGNINLNFDDAVLDFVSANPMTVSQPLNNLNWDFTNLNPFESRTIDLVLNVNSAQETPPVNINDILNFIATVSPTQNDETPADNTCNFRQTVIGSFDPNDKTCIEGNTITPEMVGDYLHYVIRFQNSGTAAAQNIVVKDIIDTAKFDINTLQLTNSSHTNVTRITGNKVEFIFEYINLPAEIDNEPGSHGYVAFKIKSKSNLVLGNVIQNKADIFFDYNFPIVTNTTSTTVAVLHVNDFETNSVSVSPIPVTDTLQIKALETITMVQLFDIQGRLLQTKVGDSAEATLDLSGKSKGVYLVKVQTEKGIKVQKVIKE